MMTIKSIAWDGKKITKPGCYSGISIDEYHNPDICDGPSVSSSMLRKLNPDIGSPAHFYVQWPGNPDRVDDADTKRHFVVGRAMHHLVLGEKIFAKVFVSQPAEYPDSKTGELKPWNNNANYCRDWHEARRREGRTALTPKEIESIKQMAISVGNHPLVKAGILNGLIERSIFWRDKETGVWLKWRPDAIPTHSADFCEFKTTQSVMFPTLVRQIRDLGYYQQAALGIAACREVLGLEMGEFRFLFVEKGPPYCTADFALEQEDIKRGFAMNRLALRTFAECYRTKRWPGPHDGREGDAKIALAPQARQSLDDRLSAVGIDVG